MAASDSSERRRTASGAGGYAEPDFASPFPNPPTSLTIESPATDLRISVEPSG